MRSRWKWALVVLLVLVATGELVLRALGLGDPLLYVADPRYEYLMAPDQDLRHGAIRYTTNALGLRNAPIGPRKRRRVLVFGDSVINGGFETTQDSLATGLAQAATGVELINISAASWGPDNAMAFLRGHGAFGADGLIAVFSSHDAFDAMTFRPIVGLHPAYPANRPSLAWCALMDRLRFRTGLGWRPERTGSAFVRGWRDLRDTCLALGIPFTVLLHAEQGEVAAHHYDPRGTRILDSLHAWNAAVVELIHMEDTSLYADRIHLNSRGQHLLATALERACMGPLDTTSRTFGRAQDPSDRRFP